MPYKTAVGTTYDSGDFAPILDKALALSDYDGFKARRREAKSRGRYRGIGVSCMLEHAGGTPLEGAWLTFPGDGTLTVNLNVQSTGQGHASVFRRLVADRLGIARHKVGHRHGDSALEIAGYASVGSRSAMTAGAAIVRCIDLILEKGKRIAAMLFEAAEGDIVYELGHFVVAGTDRRISLFELAARAARTQEARHDRGGPRHQGDDRDAAHLPERRPHRRGRDRSRDRAHGHRRLHRGRRLRQRARPHDRRRPIARRAGARPRPGADGAGGLRRRHGQLVTGSFMDYAMPRADDMPPIRDALLCVPATTNPLGVKGVGEAGTTASIAAVMNAVADAIPGGAAAHLDMPASAARLWEACRRAHFAEQQIRNHSDRRSLATGGCVPIMRRFLRAEDSFGAAGSEIHRHHHGQPVRLADHEARRRDARRARRRLRRRASFRRIARPSGFTPSPRARRPPASR